jgi:DNA repair protein REV1
LERCTSKQAATSGIYVERAVISRIDAADDTECDVPQLAAMDGAEISSANYPARSFGIYAGMQVRDAKKLCAQLIVLPYDFERIQSISETVFKMFLSVTPDVQAVSCDEAYLDLTTVDSPVDVVRRLCQDIFRSTGCTVSAGLGSNMMLARLATSLAKPNGLAAMPSDPRLVTAYLDELPVSVLPGKLCICCFGSAYYKSFLLLGVGHAMTSRLRSIGITKVAQLRVTPLPQLRELFGPRQAKNLQKFAAGEDDRPLIFQRLRKSIGAEVNYGIRYTTFKSLQRLVLM